MPQKAFLCPFMLPKGLQNYTNLPKVDLLGQTTYLPSYLPTFLPFFLPVFHLKEHPIGANIRDHIEEDLIGSKLFRPEALISGLRIF